MTDYIALILKEDGTSYGVNFPDFPGFVTGGESLDDVMRRARDGLAFHVEGMIENGDAIPTPSTADQVRADPDNAGAVVVLVDLPPVKTYTTRQIGGT